MILQINVLVSLKSSGSSGLPSLHYSSLSSPQTSSPDIVYMPPPNKSSKVKQEPVGPPVSQWQITSKSFQILGCLDCLQI